MRISFRLLGIPQNRNNAVTRIKETQFSGAINLDLRPEIMFFQKYKVWKFLMYVSVDNFTI
jgi:hypothetical protein